MENISVNTNEVNIVKSTSAASDQTNERKARTKHHKQTGRTHFMVQVKTLDIEQKFNKYRSSINPPSSLFDIGFGKDFVEIDRSDESINKHVTLALLTSLRSTVIHLDPNVKWIQNGITVAGGNGRGPELNQLNQPLGLSLDDDQSVYIADSSNDRIVEWKCGATIGQVIVTGKQLNSPTDVIVDREKENLIICDWGNGRVVRWLRRSGTNEETIISNVDCQRLTIDHHGFLYISDAGANDVTRWHKGNTDGIVVAGGNGQGDRLDQFNCPMHVFVDQEHSVYVSDFYNHRVMKWIEGVNRGTIVAGGRGQGNDLTQLSNPTGLVVDQLGTIYIADTWNHRIMRWFKGSKQGEVVVGGSGQGTQANQLDRPVSLSFDRYGNLYVVDSENARVQKFHVDPNSYSSSLIIELDQM